MAEHALKPIAAFDHTVRLPGSRSVTNRALVCAALADGTSRLRGWLDSEFRDFAVTKSVAGPRGEGTATEFDYSGNPLIAAPEWSLSGVVEYQIPLSRWGSLVPQYDFSYRSKTYLDPQHADPISQDPYWLHNARLAYRTPDGRWEVAGWVRNFMDEQYKIDVFDFTRDFQTILEVWGDPRTYGLTVAYAW